MEYAKKEVAADEGWTAKHATAVAREFERFMVLKTIDDDISPSYDIDMLWHQLLLDTGFYYKYCMDKFGKIIPHYPQNSKDAAKRTARLAKTMALYKTAFGTTPPAAVWAEDDDDCSSSDEETPAPIGYVDPRTRTIRQHRSTVGNRARC